MDVGRGVNATVNQNNSVSLLYSIVRTVKCDTGNKIQYREANVEKRILFFQHFQCRDEGFSESFSLLIVVVQIIFYEILRQNKHCLF